MELSGPLPIAEVPIPGSGTLGITHCPGRNTIDAARMSMEAQPA